jgi:DNA-binding response OmpR family regulator
MENMRIVLVVDDDRAIVELMRDFLEAEGFQVHTALDAVEAEAILDRATVDCVLLDVMMPGEFNGLQVCRRLREMQALAHTKVVLLSARAQATDIQEGMAAGADAYMVKPFSPQRLIETVQRLVPNL